MCVREINIVTSENTSSDFDIDELMQMTFGNKNLGCLRELYNCKIYFLVGKWILFVILKLNIIIIIILKLNIKYIIKYIKYINENININIKDRINT